MVWQQTDKTYSSSTASFDTHFIIISASASASTWYHSFSSLRSQKTRCPRCGASANFIGYGSDTFKSWEEYQCPRCGYRFKTIFSRSVMT